VRQAQVRLLRWSALSTFTASRDAVGPMTGADTLRETPIKGACPPGCAGAVLAGAPWGAAAPRLQVEAQEVAVRALLGGERGLLAGAGGAADHKAQHDAARLLRRQRRGGAREPAGAQRRAPARVVVARGRARPREARLRAAAWSACRHAVDAWSMLAVNMIMPRSCTRDLTLAAVHKVAASDSSTPCPDPT
jgi:hypothetical protein